MQKKTKHHKSSKTARTNAYLSITTLNINGLDSLIKRAQTRGLHRKVGTLYLLPLRATPNYKRQTPEGEGWRRMAKRMDLGNKQVSLL